MSLATETSNIKVVRVNFNPKIPSLADSMDVEVSSIHDKTHKMARIPLLVPIGESPVLEISAKGAESWSRNFKDVPAGSYDFRVRASGIVFKAQVSNNGSVFKEIGGFLTGSGKISHKAINIDAKDVEIGRFSLDVAGAVPAVGDPGSLLGDAQTCNVVYSTAAGNPNATAASPSTATLSVQLISPDEKIIPGAVITVEVSSRVESNNFNVAGGSRTPDLDEETFKNSCQAQCPFIADAEIPRKAQVLSRSYFDYSSPHSYITAQNQFTAKNFKLCENIGPVVEDWYSTHSGPPADLSTVAVEWSMAKEWGNVIYVAYQEPACKPQFLFQRKACGCFAADTAIRMADGSQKNISDLTENDKIWNPVTKQAQSIRRMTRGPETVPM
ncbi:MAG: hypothetical protein EOP09_14830, partial [Proteobacteria bacterium]